jgi:hypothetical protein
LKTEIEIAVRIKDFSGNNYLSHNVKNNFARVSLQDCGHNILKILIYNLNNLNELLLPTMLSIFLIFTFNKNKLE